MTNTNKGQFRERLVEVGAEFKKVDVNRSLMPSTEGLKLDTSFDISQLEGFAAPQFEIKGVADKVKPQGLGELRIDADLGKIDEGVRKIHEQQKNKQVQNWIEEAQNQIAQKQYRPAISFLDKALSVDPISAQALFLKGYCFFGLKEYDAALDVLREARKHAHNSEIIVMILVLQAGCVRAATAAFEAKLGKLIEEKRFGQALSLIESELSRQPSNIALLYHRCGVFLLMGKPSQAKHAALEAVERVGKENAGLFRELLNQIILQENQPIFEAIRIAIRRGDLAQAIKKVEDSRSILSGQKQYEAIRSYILERNPPGFIGSLFSRNKVAPLPEDGRQKLLLWLLAEELNTALKALDAGRFDKVEVSLSAAGKIDNRCSIICYLHGLAIFRQFEQALQSNKSAPDLNHSIQRLGIALDLFRRASADPTVVQQSKNIQKVVTNYHSQLVEIAHQERKKEQEARPINELIQDFNALMESLQGTIGSEQDIKRAENKFHDQRKRAQSLRKGRTKDQGGEVLDQIIAAIDRNLKQLDDLRGEMRRGQLVAECIKEFTTMMDYYKKYPISNHSELQNARNKVQNLQQRVAQVRTKQTRGSESWQVLDQLDEALRNVKSQLN